MQRPLRHQLATAECDGRRHGERDDGAKQLAYKGKPLYYWSKDQKPGDRTGDGVNGVWHVAKP